MRGCAAILILSSLVLSLPAVSQCPYSRVASVPFRTTAYDLALDGNDLWLASGYGLSLYDRSVDPPKLTAVTAVPQTTRLVRVANGLAYAAGGDAVAVVRKNGRQLQVVSTLTAPGAVNDLLLTTNYLYAATRSGLVQYDLLDPLHPSKTAASFATSSANVTSLALSGATLFAADGDPSVEAFDVSTPPSPQRRTSLSSSLRPTTVRLNNNRIYLSDGLQSEVFLTPTTAPASAGVVALPTTSIAPISGDAFFAAGTDRRVRAFDLAIPGSPIEIYRNETPISSGNVNRVLSMAAVPGRLYVAAGDGGLVTYDTSAFVAPFALRSYAMASPPSSVVSIGDHVYLASSSGGIVEYGQSPAGQLTAARNWDGSHADVVRDGATGFLLSTSGASAALWTLNSTIPTVISSGTFPKPVVSAALAGLTAIAVLSDGTVSTLDMSLQSPSPQAVALAGATAIGSVARSGNSVVFAQENAATTTLFELSDGQSLNTPPLTATVAGTPVGGVALGGHLAAVFTFTGINLADFSTSPPTVHTLARSNTDLPVRLAFSGSSLLEVTSSDLIVWNTDGSGSVAARYALPSGAVALQVADNSTIADIATGNGVSSVALSSASRLPAPFAAPSGNTFYRKVAAGGGRIYLFNGSSSASGSVDILTSALSFVANTGGGQVDVAASDKGFFTVSAASVVTAWSPDGVALKTTSVASGADTQPLAIFTAGNAVWVSLSRGCLSSGCEKVTLVLDSVTLAQTDQLTGGVTDAGISGNRAYALVDFPKEIRVYDISNAAHPVQIAMRAISDATAPVSISGDGTNVYVLGDRLVTYSAASLTPVATQLDSFAGVSGANAYTDQRLRGDGSCLLVSGRNANAIYSAANPSSWSVAVPFDAPSFVRSAAFVPGTFYLLTDHSLEVLSTTALPKPAKRHATLH